MDFSELIKSISDSNAPFHTQLVPSSRIHDMLVSSPFRTSEPCEMESEANSSYWSFFFSNWKQICQRSHIISVESILTPTLFLGVILHPARSRSAFQRGISWFLDETGTNLACHLRNKLRAKTLVPLVGTFYTIVHQPATTHFTSNGNCVSTHVSVWSWGALVNLL